ncbi:MAG TPA: hypothetical protein VFE61_17035 [Candidatus Sulfotelmatobacter sp.]|jgi:hypothetical protein|nr:hypothetical protein [Candidatus Sulfotelmatobacter sp.]
MKTRVLLSVFLLAGIALAANPQDEALVRNAYAKLAYASQTKIVAIEAQSNSDLTTADLSKKLQDNELRFEITAMSSGSISDIESRPYSEFVTRPDQQKVLSIPHETHSVTEFGKLLAISLFATPHWTTMNGESREDWDMPVKALVYSGNAGKYSRYVTATITVSFQGTSRTYHTLWLFSDSDVMCVDLVTGDVVRYFVKESVFPSVLTDTHLRYHPAVEQWLTSTQRFDASCKAGKLDVCCDSAMHCGVLEEDLRTKPAPNMLTPKERQ